MTRRKRKRQEFVGEPEATEAERTAVLALLSRGNRIQREANQAIAGVNAALDDLAAKAARERGLPKGAYYFTQDGPEAPMVLRTKEDGGGQE